MLFQKIFSSFLCLVNHNNKRKPFNSYIVEARKTNLICSNFQNIPKILKFLRNLLEPTKNETFLKTMQLHRSSDYIFLIEFCHGKIFQMEFNYKFNYSLNSRYSSPQKVDNHSKNNISQTPNSIRHHSKTEEVSNSPRITKQSLKLRFQ